MLLWRCCAAVKNKALLVIVSMLGILSILSGCNKNNDIGVELTGTTIVQIKYLEDEYTVGTTSDGKLAFYTNETLRI